MQESFQSPRGNCVILPPPMTEGRVLSRRAGAAAQTVDSLWRKHLQRLLLRDYYCLFIYLISYALAG